MGAVPELHVDLDLAVDLNHDATEQDVPVIVQVHDDVQVHLQNGIWLTRRLLSRSVRRLQCSRCLRLW